MLYCQSCGTPNRDGSRFCSKCGFSLETGDRPVTEQPENPYAYKPVPTQQPVLQMPSTHLWQAIVVTILCCAPLGIPAIVFASQVQARFNAGDIKGAQNTSRKARNFCIWSLILGIIGWIIYFILVFIGVIGEVLLD